MHGLDLLRQVVNPAANNDDPADRLIELAKTFHVEVDVAKRRTGGVERLALDDLQVDHDYQRPPDWAKIEAFRQHLRSGKTLAPIRVNRRPDGSHWITDGQHRAAAAALEGHDHIDAVLTHKPQQEEPQETGLVAKAGGRIPAGDPRRGRIHPGEWTKESNPATLKKAAEEAESLPERAVIHHRLSQLRGTHAVAGLLSDEQHQLLTEQLAQAREQSTAAGAKAAVLAHEDLAQNRRAAAIQRVLGYNWEQQVLYDAMHKHPSVRAAVAAEKRAERAYMQVRQQAEGLPYVDTPLKQRQRLWAKMDKAREAMLDARMATRNATVALGRSPSLGSFPNPADAAEKLGVDLDRHLSKHRVRIAKAERELLANQVKAHREHQQGRAEHVKGQLAGHAEAKKLATSKARDAKRLTPVFERQTLAGRFIGDLKKNPGHVRAMFLESGILRDGIAYSEWTRPLKPVKQRTAAVYAHPDEIRRVLGIGTLGAQSEKQIAQWAELRSAATTAVHTTGKTLTRTDLERHLKQHAPAVTAAQRRQFIELALVKNKEHISTGEIEEWQRARNFEFRTTAEVPAEHEDQLVDALIGAGAKVTDHQVYMPGYRSWADRQMDSGKRFTLELGHGKRVYYVPHHTVGTRQVAKYRHTFTFGGYSPQKKAALLKKIDAEIATHGAGSFDLPVLSNLRAAVESAPRKPVVLSVETEKFERPALRAKELYPQIKANQRKLPKPLRDAIYSTPGPNTAALLEDLLGHSREKGEGRRSEPHKAPFSERGVLHLDGLAPADALRMLKRLGAAKGLAAEVPYNLIYRSGRRNGRVLPHHEDYATGEHALSIPKGYAVFHGLTGGADTVTQVKRLIRDGGIKAIAERRRLGRRTGGMSVKGDMGSGIDQYVFTNMHTGPAYGRDGVVFMLKPSALKRRDVAFAPRDYGGGQDRYDKYNAHAKRLGQKAFHDPPSHGARQKHLNGHLGQRLAEVLIKHEVPWEDVDTVYVGQRYFKDVEKLMRAAKRQGRVPQELRVVQGHSEIPARIGQLSPDQD